MGKNEIITNVSNKTGYSKTDCEKIVDAFSESISEALVNGEKVIIKGFMSFEITERPERKGRNPKTGELTTFPPVKSVNCKIAQAIKDKINDKEK